MKRKIAYLILVVCIVGIICILTKNILSSNKQINYDEIKFNRISISESKMNRYNELINIPEVSFLIRNLPTILNNTELTIDSAIKYSYIYAYTFKNDIDKYVVHEENSIYANSEYLENIIFELFNRKIDLDYYKEKNGFVLVNTSNMITDSINLNISEISYNADYDIYKIIIQEYDRLIKIIYKNDNGKYTLLWCLSDNVK